MPAPRAQAPDVGKVALAGALRPGDERSGVRPPGQRSIISTAAALELLTRKSSAPRACRWARSKTSWRGEAVIAVRGMRLGGCDCRRLRRNWLLQRGSGRRRCGQHVDRHPRPDAAVEGAGEVDLQGEADEHADGGGDGDCHQHADEAEKIAENEQRKDQPHRMQADLRADDVGREEAGIEHLGAGKNTDDGEDRHCLGPVLAQWRWWLRR